MPEEGAGVAGQHAKQGYMLLLALLVRPVLMVVGLWGGIILSRVLVNFAGQISIPFLATVHGSNLVGIVGWLAGMVIMALIALSVVRRSFNLIWELADRVIRWIGHSGEQLGESQDEQDIKNKFFMAYSAVKGGKGAIPQKAAAAKNTIGGDDNKEKDKKNDGK